MANGKENFKNPAAVSLGKLGGLKGGNARAQKLSPERRKEISEIANKARKDKKFGYGGDGDNKKN